ncbi:MAG: hypothetical protein Q7T26_01540 [Dehalococcoidia bacterium]|nr:hypothetical protein [Dehalococcoidia bacterium]
MRSISVSSQRVVRALPAALLLLAAVAVALPPTDASAHERRTVGKYQFVVGFFEEPALEGQPNGVGLRVTDTSVTPPRSVEGVEKTLKVTVSQGPASKEMALQTVFGQPGSYRTVFIPTRPGRYIFQFTGDIEGAKVDQRFESGPGRFSDIEAADPLQFPQQVPGGLAVSQQTAQAATAAQQAQDSASTATLLGVAGVVVGVAGLAVGLLALAARRPAEKPPAK